MNCPYFDFEKEIYQISSIPRKIHCAREFKYPSDKKIRDNLKKIMQKIKNGDDINPYLSKQYEKDNPDSFWQSYGIYHIHIPTDNVESRDTQGFAPRSKCRLFASFTADAAYLLYVDENHEKELFRTNKLLEIIVSNDWADRLLRIVNVSVDSRPQIPEHMLHKSRECGATTIQDIGGKTIINGSTIKVGDKTISANTFLLKKFLEYNMPNQTLEQRVAFYHSSGENPRI